MQFLDNRKFNRQEICAVFGVPQELLGFTEDANRSVGDAARLNFIENKITPLCEMLESDLEDLVGEYEAEGEELYAWFDLESLPVMQKARRESDRFRREAFRDGSATERDQRDAGSRVAGRFAAWRQSILAVQSD
jgi:phage portal protein BeeE